jgi:poly-gamma-glutamate capsule biosynthesis protein CapA/YwtB (metallophosphatase superfamily)
VKKYAREAIAQTTLDQDDRKRVGTMKMNSDPTLRMSFVGDIALNGRYEDLLLEAKGQNLAASVASLLVGSDITIGNLEGPLTSCGSAGPPWRFGLHGNPAYAHILRSAGIGVVSLANNHAMDHGWQGLQETQQLLDAVGIKHVGAGVNLRAARQPLHLTVRDARIAILAYCDVPTLSPLYAGDDCPGVAPLHRASIFEDIGAVKQTCDFLILCMHWGQENIGEPAPRYRRLAQEMISTGADVIVGHHPHVLQGTETVGRGIVAYSLGNFTFSNQDWQGTNRNGETFSMPYRLSEANRRSAVWKILIDPKGGIAEEAMVPVYLGQDLLPALDPRPKRKRDFARSNAVLKMRAYGLVWSIRMIGSRFRVILDLLRGEQGLGKRLLRLRPRHVRDLLRLLAREWEQFRGTE